MNRVDQQNGTPGDDLDALLRAFFKAQMPAPWPAFKPPARARTLPPRPAGDRPWSPIASHLALAASMALLLFGFWMLPAGRNGGGPGTIPTIGSPVAGKGLPKPDGTVPDKLTPDKASEKRPRDR
jgi:hypothetical protein